MIKKSVIAIRKMTITPLCHAEKPVLDFFSEGNVDAEGEPCVLAHRDALLRIAYGEKLTQPKFTHAQLMQGGEMVLQMSDRPNKELWA